MNVHSFLIRFVSSCDPSHYGLKCWPKWWTMKGLIEIILPICRFYWGVSSLIWGYRYNVFYAFHSTTVLWTRDKQKGSNLKVVKYLAIAIYKKYAFSNQLKFITMLIYLKKIDKLITCRKRLYYVFPNNKRITFLSFTQFIRCILFLFILSYKIFEKIRLNAICKNDVKPEWWFLKKHTIFFIENEVRAGRWC